MKTSRKLLPLAILATAVFGICAPSFAHHAWRGYDMNNTISVKGTITNFDWSNPHVWMDLDVKDEKGNTVKWSAGGPSPSRMANNGWDKMTLKPGDQITAVGNRINDGTFKIRLQKVVLSNGKELACYGRSYGA